MYAVVKYFGDPNTTLFCAIFYDFDGKRLRPNDSPFIFTSKKKASQIADRVEGKVVDDQVS